MTNAEVIAVNQRGIRPRPVVVSPQFPMWASDDPDSPNVKYIAMVNRNSNTAEATLTLNALGFTSCRARNLWTKKDIGSFTTSFSQSLPVHASGLFRLISPALAIQRNAVLPVVSGMHGGVYCCMISKGRIAVPAFRCAANVCIYNLEGRLLSSMKMANAATGLRILSPNHVYIVRALE